MDQSKYKRRNKNSETNTCTNKLCSRYNKSRENRDGKQKQKNTNTSVVEFAMWNKKIQVLRGEWEKLNGSNMFINEDHPQEILEQRKILIKNIKEGREATQQNQSISQIEDV